MLRIENLTFRFGKRVLFDRAVATIHAGRRVGLVGRNGAGKTTLLRLIAGVVEPDDGIVDVPPRWRIGMTRQEAPSGSRSPLWTVLAADRELESLEREAERATDPARVAEIHERLRAREAHSAPARAARILAGLGFDRDAQQRPLDEFSGGWRMRVMLASLLFAEPDLLLLDEPTNHLDLESAMWLEDYLRTYRGTVVVVSHDRGLLNGVAREIVHLDQGKLNLYKGDYDRFERTRRLRLEQEGRLRANLEAERARIRKFVDRFRYKATKARQAQSRLKMLERMEPVPERREDAPVGIDFPDPGPLAPPLFAARGVSVGYGGQPVLRRLSFRLDGDDRIALLGANGNGKSTLIRLLAGRLEPEEGTVTAAPGLRTGYFAQHQADELDLEATPSIELARRRSGDAPERIRSRLARFGFSQERSETAVADLSGGEKARLLFALMTAHNPHLLLLDEPTNHLDAESRRALIHAVNAFAGAVVLVSHDPHVAGLVADRLWLVADGAVAPFDGDMEDYRTFLLERRSADSQERGTAERERPAGGRERRRAAAARREALAPLRGRFEQAERRVEELAAGKKRIEALMTQPETYEGDGERLVALQKDFGRVVRDLKDAEEVWLRLGEELEAARSEVER